MTPVESSFKLKSSAFENNQTIPAKYANTGVSGGENISVPLSWENPPGDVKSFAVSIIDRHPIADNWVHWLVINIPANTTSLPEGASGSDKIPGGSLELNNTFGFKGYGGPQPPPRSGAHNYEVTMYALNTEGISLTGEISASEFESAVNGKVIAKATLIGKFSR
ncbi:MAG: YbhB/YbcL family Raf kinase inhibitor-like protein [Actinobacteria bacterium]|nr:YbhB/YbcL family Raf kinase inhibitor-like protein [Actinomycetota bacterium]